jgi:hypothetical protein
MHKIQSRSILSRRTFLKLLAAVGVTTAGGYVLTEVAPWLDYDEQANQIRRPFEKTATMSVRMQELIRYATLAANGHNTQPWKFAIKEDAIEIHPDYTRRLPVVDPHDRELWISLGCALENLLVAARATGYAAEVTYPNAADYIHIRLTADTPQHSPLFEAIEHRQNTRSEYQGQPIKVADLDNVQALPLESGVALRYVLYPTELETVLEYVNQGNLRQYTDQAFIDELIYWLRFNQKEAMASLDGLFSRCSGNPEVPGWLGRMFVAGTKPQQQADADARKLRSSPGAVVIASEGDDKAAWVRTGQVYERLALKMTSLNIKSALLNQPLEVAELRSQFQSAMGLGASAPQLLVRFGYADPMPRSLRRPVEQVIMSPKGINHENTIEHINQSLCSGYRGDDSADFSGLFYPTRLSHAAAAGAFVCLGRRGNAGRRTAALQPDLSAGLAGCWFRSGTAVGGGGCLAGQLTHVAFSAGLGLVQQYTDPASAGLVGVVGGCDSGQRHHRGSPLPWFCLRPSTAGIFV